MPTAQVIVNNALTLLGILEQGGTPSSSDSTDALNELNAMWDAWGIDEGLIYAETEISKALTAATAAISIGTGATWSTTKPAKIYRAFIGSSSNRTELEIVSAARYRSHNDLTAAAATPDELYPDYNEDPTTGFMTLYTWPVQSGTPTLYLDIAVPFTAFVLATTYNLPPGYQDAIQYALAFRLIPRFVGSVPQEVAQVVTSLAQKGEARIREANALLRQIPPPASVTPEAQQQMAAQQKG
jgi:hypothetical protein